MSRQELAEAVAAYLFEHAGRAFTIDAHYIGKLERGQHRWPSAHYRTALQAVLGRDTDAELGFYILQGRASDAATVEPDAPGEAGEPAGSPEVGGPNWRGASLAAKRPATATRRHPHLDTFMIDIGSNLLRGNRR